MKLNGALKPRHGASSSKGSSLGAEQLQRYRDKEQQRYQLTAAAAIAVATVAIQKDTKTPTYLKQNHNLKQYHHHDVVDASDANDVDANDDDADNEVAMSQKQQQQQQLFHKCGVVNNQANNISQHLEQTQQEEQQSQRSSMKCVENSLSSEQGHYTNNTNNNHNKNPTRNRITSVTKTTAAAAATTTATQITLTTATLIDYNRHGNSGANNEVSNKKEVNEQEDVRKVKPELQQLNITTRQATNNNSNTKSSQNINKQQPQHQSNKGHTATTQKHFPIVNSHVTLLDRHYTQSTSNNHSATFIGSLSSNEVVLNENTATPLTTNTLPPVSTTIYDIPILWSRLLVASLIISAIFKQFIRFVISLTFLMFSPKRYSTIAAGTKRDSSKVANMRASQSFNGANVSKSRLAMAKRGGIDIIRAPTSTAVCWMLVYGIAAMTLLQPQTVLADDGDTFFSPNGIAIGETTTAEFDYAARGQKKFGDKCDNTLECGFPGSICHPKSKSCKCTDDLPITNHIDKCGKGATVNESCFFNEQCEAMYLQTECRDGRCVCRFDMAPIWLKDGSVECKGRGDQKTPETYIDPAMIGVLIGMALMFIIICVVLRLFSQARWRENRTIFNTPNPRLMNVSLLREGKLLHGQERRGSRMSVRAPSRQPSMASLRPHSPNPSLGSRSNSHGSSASATSLRSTRSNSVSPAVNNTHHERKGSTYHPHQHHQEKQQPSLHEHQAPHQQHLQPLAAQHQHHQQQQSPPQQQTNIIANPVAESVTVEIIEPEK